MNFGSGSIDVQPARIEDVARFIELRGRTRENAISESRLASLGITVASWSDDMRSGRLVGYSARAAEALVGYCFGNAESGEIVVLALLPEAEGQGLGRRLLGEVVNALGRLGHRRLFLGTSPDPMSRSYGFYRHLGWQPTGTLDKLNDEVLELELLPGGLPTGVT